MVNGWRQPGTTLGWDEKDAFHRRGQVRRSPKKKSRKENAKKNQASPISGSLSRERANIRNDRARNHLEGLVKWVLGRRGAGVHSVFNSFSGRALFGDSRPGQKKTGQTSRKVLKSPFFGRTIGGGRVAWKGGLRELKRKAIASAFLGGGNPRQMGVVHDAEKGRRKGRTQPNRRQAGWQIGTGPGPAPSVKRKKKKERKKKKTPAHQSLAAEKN